MSHGNRRDGMRENVNGKIGTKEIMIILVWVAAGVKDPSLTDTLDIGFYMCLLPLCGFCCPCVYSVAYPVFV